MHTINNTSISPRNLTDKELIRFATRYAQDRGLPQSFQFELIKRFEDALDRKL